MNALLAALLLALCLHAAHAQDITPAPKAAAAVSKGSGKIAAGSAWETEYYFVDSGVSGPTALIVGGMHGNEPAGSHAAEQILHWPIVRGRLLVVPRANVLALKANTRLTPGQPREDGNLNRNFPRDDAGAKVVPRGELAAALWQFAFKASPDWVIDLHEGFDSTALTSRPRARASRWARASSMRVVIGWTRWPSASPQQPMRPSAIPTNASP